MHSELCLLTVWPVFTWWTFFAYLLLGEKNQPVQRKCLFCPLHSLEFIFLEVIASSTVNLERILTNCNARGREMTERAKDASRGVSSLCSLSRLTTSFQVHVYCVPNCARINHLCKIPVYSKLSLFMLTRNVCCYEIAVWKSRFWNARIINCFTTGKVLFFVGFFCHVIIPFRSHFACRLLSAICNSLTCPSTSLFQGRKLCSVNMG